jgi:ferredoxin
MGWLSPSDRTPQARVVRRRASAERPALWSRRELLRLRRSRTRPDGPWTVAIQAELCSDCGACLRVCSESALARRATGATVVYTIDSRRCNGCGDCAEVCAETALRIERLALPQTITEAACLPATTCGNCGVHAAGLRNGLCAVCLQTRLVSRRKGRLVP